MRFRLPYLALFALLARPAFAESSAPAIPDPLTEIHEIVPQARAILDRWQAEQPQRAGRKLHIVYWTPSDREPAAHYRERLSAILERIRDFYAKQMERLGFGPRTIGLDRAADGLINIHVVKGSQPYSHYAVKSGAEIRRECLPVLHDAGLEGDHETIVIFCNMSNWDSTSRTISQNSPYYASGDNRAGTAWQVDSPILDGTELPNRGDQVHDGQYGHISLGRYNSIFIGGIAHELGHSLGLPHNRERPDEKEAFGTALMGGGNRTFGEELRGESKGSFITLAHGLRLASHPMFCGSVKELNQRPTIRLEEIHLAGEGKTLTFSAKVITAVPAYAVIGYLDPDGNGDYDATTCVAVPDAAGHFTLRARPLPPGKAGRFRVVVLCVNGFATSFASPGEKFSWPFQVNGEGMAEFGSKPSP